MKSFKIVCLLFAVVSITACAGGPRRHFGGSCVDIKKELTLTDEQYSNYRDIGKSMRKQMSASFEAREKENQRLSKFVVQDKPMTVESLKAQMKASSSQFGPDDEALTLIVKFHNSLSKDQKVKMAELIEDGKLQFGPRRGPKF